MDRPDKRNRKAALAAWKAERQAAARAALPLSDDRMQALFDMLSAELPRRGCDRSLRLTSEWLAANGQPFEPVAEWLRSHGGCCDCEALANAEQAWRSALVRICKGESSR